MISLRAGEILLNDESSDVPCDLTGKGVVVWSDHVYETQFNDI